MITCKFNIFVTDVCAQVHKGINMLYAENTLPKELSPCKVLKSPNLKLLSKTI